VNEATKAAGVSPWQLTSNLKGFVRFDLRLKARNSGLTPEAFYLGYSTIAATPQDNLCSLL